MVKPIVKDVLFLGQKSLDATIEDLSVAQDLLDTLIAHADGCVGMAANMIGVKKRIIAVQTDKGYRVMINPHLLKGTDRYQTEEGCLSLQGKRPTTRYQKIKVEFVNERFQMRVQNFEGFEAQIIQHELDHCDGVVI